MRNAPGRVVAAGGGTTFEDTLADREDSSEGGRNLGFNLHRRERTDRLGKGTTTMGAIAEEGKSAITQAQFDRWKQRKDAEAAAKAAEAGRKREEDIAAGRVRMNGRELYKHEPWVFDDQQYS